MEFSFVVCVSHCSHRNLSVDLFIYRLTAEYMQSAQKFVKTVEKNFGYPEKLLCPCKECRNLSHQRGNIVYEHLVINGMDPTYTTWFHHGEEVNTNEELENVDKNDIYELYKAAYGDENDYIEQSQEHRLEELNEKMNDWLEPLYPGCSKYNKLSAVVALFKHKTMNGWSDCSFDGLLELLHDMLPEPNVLIRSTYKVRKFMREFHLGYEKIHACPNDCCLFRKDKADLDKCPRCHASRWKVDKHTKKAKVGVPAKVLRYLPIIPRFKAMFKSEKMAHHLRWHSNNKRGDGKMHHPVDSPAWQLVNEKWPTFANEARNLRLGLSTDGFNPFGNLSSTYSCWPVMLVIYNLPPFLCMKKENIMLTLLIPGSKQPGNDIDIYLQPLIEDLQELWNNGVSVFDSFDKEVFNLRAILMWTINDFPAYGNLSGCYTKGRLACPLCVDNTRAMWLPFSRKFVFMGHRRFLSPSHPFRTKKCWFNGKIEKESKPRIMTGRRMYEQLKDFVNDWGKVNMDIFENEVMKGHGRGGKKVVKKVRPKRKRVEVRDVDMEKQQLWKKRSLFFYLPYWQVITTYLIASF